ncbi:MAG: type VI secretion protein IcmF/TssM N-terminal domain-containing protein [Planctomycetota bacterium]
MSEDAKPTPMGRIRSRLRISLAAKATIALAVSMWLIAGAVWVVYSLDPTRVAWGDYMTLGRGAGLLALWAFACLAMYWTVRIWMHEIPISDPKMRDGWNAGVNLLARHGKRFSDLPCFLVLGCPTKHQQDQWMRTHGIGTSSTDSTTTPSIDWHLRDDCLLVFLRDVGLFGQLSNPSNRKRTTRGLRELPVPGRERKGPHDMQSSDESLGPEESQRQGSVALDSGQAGAPSTGGAAEGNFDRPNENDSETDAMEGSDDGGREASEKTVAVGHPDSSKGDTSTENEARVATATRKQALHGRVSTTELHALQTLDRAGLLIEDAKAFRIATPAPAVAEPLTSIETAEGQASLADFCARLRAARYPHSPINGTLVVLDSSTLESQHDTVLRAGQSIHSDLSSLERGLGVTTSVTLMVTEPNRIEEFGELGHRMSERTGSVELLGHAVAPQECLHREAIGKVAESTVDTLERQINQCFQVGSEGESFDGGTGLTNQNHRLMRILIRCRRWRRALRDLLVEFVSDGVSRSGEEPSGGSRMFGGVFVGAPAPAELKRGFMDAMVERLVKQQNHLVWTRRSERQFARQRLGLMSLIGLVAVQLIILVVQTWLWLQD